MLARHPGFTVSVILILALGIGANTAIFSVVNAVLFKPFPNHAPDRIVTLTERNLPQGVSGVASSHPTLIYWREHSQVFESIVGMQLRRFYVTSPERSSHVIARAVSPGYFSVMGMKPMLGRGFFPEEEQPGHEPVVVLSFAFWRDRMGGDPHAIGRSLVLDGQGHTIVGIMPAAFGDTLRRCAPFWVPLILNPEHRGGGTGIRARLKPGVTLAQAQAQMDVLEKQLAEAEPEHKAGYTVVLRRFLDSHIARSRSLLYLLWGGVGLVLLVACTNASGLFLIHSNARRQEMAVRAAVGASRGQIIRHLLTEGLVLSVAAGALGVLLAYWAIRLLIRVSPIDLPRMQETRLDTPVLCFTLGVSVITGLILSFLPAWRATSIHLGHALKQARGCTPHGRRQRRLHGALVVAQIAVASTLLMAVAMLTQSLISMQKVDLGFQPANVLVAEIELPKVRYPERDHWLNFYQQVLHRIQSSPGVQSAALSSGGLDLGSGGGFSGFTIDGRPPSDPGQEPLARYMTVSQDFFKAMGMAVLRGRDFTDEDTQGDVGGIMIDENLARKYFPEQDPLGQRINGQLIVGVASTLKDYGELAPAISTIYAGQ
jgi:putative ABC transport system permease protein